ncbi:sigma 54-interacting transcriptional regulator [Lactobacillus sp. ESL0684]|uniref:sigma 54-interacting transcriptional regulator n=1 Tax=Lactobacillus sp. ESL0684 TaxID=2983213 RepID=UPI0023F98122|nr:sigma 54-interacting transcriptional regulator [Lactobacillus sp. ESL0684]WEV43401.1 sigma 54-interacting transcriptional regulator [Lactobacillus sp. ESL0684]
MENQAINILQLIKEQTTKFMKDYDLEQAPTTSLIAKKVGQDRSVISKRLNELYRSNELIKINTRPVIYLRLVSMTNTNHTYSSIAEFRNEHQNLIWEQIIGWNGSLKEVIEQLKAALIYPPAGLPAIIFGESGTGKTFLVKKLFDYGKDQEILKNESKLVVINCAQYADNPELLSSVLFGYVKDAFTGANEDKPGALQSANDGILFLDEVHRLSVEGQEKLFKYLDTGTFSPIGDDSKEIQSKTRLFFATTEKEERFLKTFLRRIPIKIKLPPLQQRGAYEQRMLTYALIIEQAKRINCEIAISKQCLSLIYHGHFQENVGQLKNCLQNIVAKKYSKALGNDKLEIKLGDLPKDLLKQVQVQHYSIAQGKEKLVFHPNDTLKTLINSDNNEFTSKIKFAWQNLLNLEGKQVKDKKRYYQVVQNATHNILYATYNLERPLISDYAEVIVNIFEVAQIDSVSFKNSSVYDIAVYLYCLMRDEFETDFSEFDNFTGLEQLFATELQLIDQIAKLLEMRFEINLTASDKLWLAILTANDNLAISPKTPAIIVAHGYATASSIADTCNHFLQSSVFTAIDLKPDISRSEMIDNLKKLVKRISPQSGLIILMDMGSLDSIIDPLKAQCECDLLVINNFSMGLALEIGNQLVLQKDLRTIQGKISQTTVQSRLCVAQTKIVPTIITTCMSGLGSAQRIKKILDQSFYDLIEVQIEALEFKELINYQELDLFTNRNVIAIVGIDNPDVPEIPYFGLEEIITGEKIQPLKNILQPFSNDKNLDLWEKRLVENFSLDRILDSLTIISPDKVMTMISKYLKGVQTDLNERISNRVQISLYVHIANMIERIIRGNEIEKYDGDNSKIERDHYFSVLKKYNSVLENAFSININDPETAYIRDIIVHG